MVSPPRLFRRRARRRRCEPTSRPDARKRNPTCSFEMLWDSKPHTVRPVDESDGVRPAFVKGFSAGRRRRFRPSGGWPKRLKTGGLASIARSPPRSRVKTHLLQKESHPLRHQRNLSCLPGQERFFRAFWTKNRQNQANAGFGAVDRLLRGPIFCSPGPKTVRNAGVLFAFLCSVKNAKKGRSGWI